MEFLCAAKEKRRSFRVFVAEGAPSKILVIDYKRNQVFLYLLQFSYVSLVLSDIRGTLLVKNWLQRDFKLQLSLILLFLP
ncbi:hypothetical protein CDL12_27477 [Handroanthus impetiginosus]|uniref:Uncharacterized protein n=1 Tax=Handroanthus impetiginosus TaxID=429701 RepID=A0A2G9G530_9LAMI|nr:hypothetical protein CDL12_27477 [Handroanthus impetiginosus]